MAVGNLAVMISPLEIYALVQQGDYANKLDELGKKLGKAGYSGDIMLADLFREKNKVEGGILASTVALSAIGSVIAVASAATVVGAPVAAVTALVVGFMGAAFKGAQQGFIELAAADFTKKIQSLPGGARQLFANNLSAQYQLQTEGNTDTTAYLSELQASYGVDLVIAVTTMQVTRQAVELAVITQLTASMTTSTTR